MGSANGTLFAGMIIIALLVSGLGFFMVSNILSDGGRTKQGGATGDTSLLTSADFSSKIDNKYLTYTPGTLFVYEGATAEGTERTEVLVTRETKRVMGVDTLVVQDKVFLNGELIEDTADWFAQDKGGNVWYFGEDSKDIVNGKIVSREGSWEAGVDGAQPGIVMKANPKKGEQYRQEYHEGQAEDMAEVVALGLDISVAYGSFSNCLQTMDWNPLESGSDEFKYYCPSVGGLVYELSIEDNEGLQLIEVRSGKGVVIPAREEPRQELQKDITEAQAIAIAKKAVNGEVADVEIESKFGKTVYAIEIEEDGEEVDVIIDIATGKVLDIEY